MNRFLTFDPIRYQMSQSERARLLQHQQQAAAFAHQQTRQQQPQQTSMNGFDRPRTPSQPGLAEMEGAHQLQSGDTRDDSGGGCLSRFFNCCPDRIDSFFRITERESSIAQEMRAGAVTFVTMAYILIVNAQILSKSGPDAHGDWMNFDSIVAATAISAAVGSALVGIWGNLPFGLAPGMGLNSYFTYGICLKLGLPWPIALTSCFFQGLLFLFLALIGACDLIQLYAPPCIKKSISVGLGLFQALIGFELMRLVIPGTETLLSIGNIYDAKIWLCVGGMMLICVLLVWKVKAAMLVGIMFITLASWALELTPLPDALIEMPTLQRPMAMLDFAGFFERIHDTLPVVLVMLFVSVFDTAGVQYMCGSEADLLDPQTDTLPGAKAAFASAGVATAIGAMLGTSPIIIHNETVAGISDGARTGLHSVTVAVLFLLSIPFVPILRAVPPIAAAAPLVIVGMCMLMAAKYIDWEKPVEGMPAFLCATILPFTYSIANGMLIGLLSYTVLKSCHKLGEIFTPERMKAQPPRECVAKTFKCKCVECAQEAISLVSSLTERQLSDTKLLGGANGTARAHSGGSVQSTPKRKPGRGEVFEDPMPGAPSFPFTSSSPVPTRSSLHRLPSASSTASSISSLPHTHSYGAPGHAHHSFRGGNSSHAPVPIEGERSISPPSPTTSVASGSSSGSTKQVHTHQIHRGNSMGGRYSYQQPQRGRGEIDPLITEQSPDVEQALT